MPIKKLCDNQNAIDCIRWCDTPTYIIEDRRVCLNCIYWFDFNGVEGRCDCNGMLSDNSGLNTWYSETCHYCYLRSKYDFDYNKEERYKYAVASQYI